MDQENMLDTALEVAVRRFWASWPSFQEWWKTTGMDVDKIPNEPMAAAIRAYLDFIKPTE